MWRLALLWLGACGRIDFDPRADAVTDSTADACAFGPWSPPAQLLGIASSGNDNGPALNPDGSVIVYTSDRGGGSGGQDLWLSFSFGPLQFGASITLVMYNSSANDFGAAWASANELYYSSDVSGTPHLYRAPYSPQLFGASDLVPELAAMPIRGATFTADGLDMFFSDATVTKFGRATRTSQTAPWQIVTMTIPELEMNVSGYPAISGDGLTIYFETDRSGTTEIYSATRPTRQSAFGAPTLFTDIDSNLTDGDPDISHDGRTFVFGSTRSGGAGGFDVYASTRTCL